MTVVEINPVESHPLKIELPLERIVAELKASRSRVKNSNAVYARDLPSPTAIAKIVKAIYGALFPRHGGGQDGGDDGLDYFVGYTLNTALRELHAQVVRELRFSKAQQNRDGVGVEIAAGELVRNFAERLPDIRETVLSDVRAAYDGDPSAQTTEEILLSFPGIKATFHHRLAHELFELGAVIVARILAEISHSATGIDIHPGAKIGKSFFIDHGTGVVIGETAVIGERVRLYQAVTLGAKFFAVDDQGALVKGVPRHPIVEDDVVVYAGATILGRVTIGRGSIIGGNVWLTRSVPPNSTIVQAQARRDTFDSGSGI